MLLLHTIFTKIQCLVVVAQLVEALYYKLKGHRFNYQRCHWDFYRLSPSGHTMALGLNQPLREMSTRSIFGGGGGGGGRELVEYFASRASSQIERIRGQL
jgi:hypothetical protein